jgi:hypothetical protein
LRWYEHVISEIMELKIKGREGENMR